MSYRAQVIVNGSEPLWRDCAPIFRTCKEAALYITALDERDTAIQEFRVIEVGVIATHTWDGTRAVVLRTDPEPITDETDVPY